MPLTYRFVAALLPLLWCAAPIPAEAQEVEVVTMPPYAIEDEAGTWRGPAVDLFRAAADEAGVDYTFVAAAEATQTEGALARFPVFADAAMPQGYAARSLPFHVDVIGLIGAREGGGFLQRLAALLNTGFLWTIGVVCALLLVAGLAFWTFERSGNDEVAADGSMVRGIGRSFWWAGVTATTIGYGDLVPKTLGGRVVAMIWMLFSMALTALLTAYLVSLTGGPGGATGLDDALAGEHVGYVDDGSVTRSALAGADRITRFAVMAQALAALDAERIDVIAYPYQAAKSVAGDRDVQRTGGSVVLPLVLVAGNEELRAALDRIILTPAWQQRMEDEFAGR